MAGVKLWLGARVVMGGDGSIGSGLGMGMMASCDQSKWWVDTNQLGYNACRRTRRKKRSGKFKEG